MAKTCKYCGHTATKGFERYYDSSRSDPYSGKEWVCADAAACMTGTHSVGPTPAAPTDHAFAVAEAARAVVPASVVVKPRRKTDVYAYYSGKVASMAYIPNPKERFKYGCMRVSDNAGEGYVLEGDKLYSISRSYRSAKPVTGDIRDRIVAAITEGMPA